MDCMVRHYVAIVWMIVALGRYIVLFVFVKG